MKRKKWGYGGSMTAYNGIVQYVITKYGIHREGTANQFAERLMNEFLEIPACTPVTNATAQQITVQFGKFIQFLKNKFK